MSNDKQSSVEYYIVKLIDILGDEIINKISAEQNERIARLEKQTQAMHKEEIEEALLFGDVLSPTTAENYYKETFG